FTDEVRPWAGRFCKDADREIIRNLRERGLLLREEVYRHDYPFCWRKMSDPLIQYARKSWFIRTTQVIDEIMANNLAIDWEPAHIKEGRFGEFLRSNVDWALSRERFWGTPLPIWINDETGSIRAIASLDEVLSLNPRALEPFEQARAKNPALSEHLAVHKPWIDQVVFSVPGEPGVYRRVPDVIDCWFDSGCMPFAQHGYPHRGQEAFLAEFPADFITEAIDQTRGWFYALLAISTMVFPEAPKPHPFRHCTVLGLITDERGQKLSKSLKNYKDPIALIEAHGADALRWALYRQSVPGQTNRWFEGAVIDAARELLIKVWNVLSFFTTYAQIDGWRPSLEKPPISTRSELDRWILAELNQTIREVDGSLERFRTHPAARCIDEFVESLSNWYVRRSRSRFWAPTGVNDHDKNAAFSTLYEVLVDLAKLIAPFAPFLGEAMYERLVRKVDPEAPLSVHLLDYPTPEPERDAPELLWAMALVRRAVSLGAQVRAARKIKVRQPLSRAIVVAASERERQAIFERRFLIEEELNVERVELASEPYAFAEVQVVPNYRLLGSRLGKDMPACRKALERADAKAIYEALRSEGEVEIEIEGGKRLRLAESEIEVRFAAKEGFAAASERGLVVLLDTTITPELRRKGLAREVLSRIQAARKAMDLPYEARIRLVWSAQGELAEAIEAHAPYIGSEALALSVERKEVCSESDGMLHESEVEGTLLRFAIAPIERGER
ncbi:MAG: class I tRNA ligase family protein, partial [Sandaracinaceae bacterium]|nr:class I tRNA ligase family protein [Sandaracinaceae bacterium]